MRVLIPLNYIIKIGSLPQSTVTLYTYSVLLQVSSRKLSYFRIMGLDYPMPEEYWKMAFAFQNEFGYIWLILAVMLGFVLAFAVGANDSANSWGTPIGKSELLEN